MLLRWYKDLRVIPWHVHTNNDELILEGSSALSEGGARVKSTVVKKNESSARLPMKTNANKKISSTHIIETHLILRC